MNEKPFHRSGGPDGRAGGTRRKRWIPIGAAIGLLLACAAFFALFQPSPPLPAPATSGIDPVVARLIQTTLDEVRAASRSGSAWGKLGSVLMHYEFVDEARYSFDRAAKLSTRDPRWPYLEGVLLLNHDAEMALTKLRRTVELCGDQPDMPRLRLAQFLAERGYDAEAEEQFQALLGFTPNHPLALLGLARLRQAQGKWTESTNLLGACLDDPHTAKAASALLASAGQALRNVAAAETAARRGASLPADAPWPDPFWAEAAAYRVGRKAALEDATALLDHGRFEDAVRHLSQFTRDYPQDEEGWYLMGWGLNQQRRGAEAERVLREHLRLSPQSPKGHSQLAIALLRQQRYAEAVGILEAALQLKPTWRELHSNLGYACVQLGRYDEAIRHFRNALATDPNHGSTCTALAELLSRRGENEEARRLLRQALQLNPADRQARSLLQKIDPTQAQ